MSLKYDLCEPIFLQGTLKYSCPSCGREMEQEISMEGDPGVYDSEIAFNCECSLSLILSADFNRDRDAEEGDDEWT